MTLELLTTTIIAQELIKPLEIRVHRAILLLHPCAKLWYLCRGVDIKGRGFVKLQSCDWQELGAKVTIYRWLREGRGLGFFRFHRWHKNGSLDICLGGLLNICEKANITNWGATADEILLSELLDGNNRRRIASAIATQDLQARSYFAAKQQLSPLEKKHFKIPNANELLSPNLIENGLGGTRGLIHIGDERIFVGKSFIPFGVSQALVCEVLESQPHSCGVSDRTLRRHLDQLGINKRQLIQAKPEYAEIEQRLNQGCIDWECKGGNIRISRTERGGIIRLDEPNGRSGSRREGGRLINVRQFSRRYFGAIWLYKCNLYGLSYTLTSMKMKRWEWKQAQAKAATAPPISQEPLTVGLSAVCPPLDPPAIESMPPAGFEAAGGDQNKADKNDNAQNAEPEPLSDISAEKPAAWEEMKAKLLGRQKQKRQAKLESLSQTKIDPMREYWAQVFGSPEEGPM